MCFRKLSIAVIGVLLIAGCGKKDPSAQSPYFWKAAGADQRYAFSAENFGAVPFTEVKRYAGEVKMADATLQKVIATKPGRRGAEQRVELRP